MKAQFNRRPDLGATLNVRIKQLQERAGELARAGKVEEARKVRGTLITLINRRDLLKAAS